VEARKVVALALAVVALAVLLGVALTALAGVYARARAGRGERGWWVSGEARVEIPCWPRLWVEWWRPSRVEVSGEFRERVVSIIESDPDAKKLLDEGFNITDVRPVFKVIVQGDGSVAVRATGALAILRKGSTGLAVVSVDVEGARVTRISVLTRTVIEKP